VHVDEVQARGRSPMPEQAWLDVLDLEALLQERVVEKVDLADGEEVRRPPVFVDLLELLLGQDPSFHLRNRNHLASVVPGTCRSAHREPTLIIRYLPRLV